MSGLAAPTSSILRLCNLGREALMPPADLKRLSSAFARFGEPGTELARLLACKNGFYAFDLAIHVFPFPPGGPGTPQDILGWNSPGLWKNAYGERLPEMLCFAEDVFGYQFCVSGGAVLRFDPETGDSESHSPSVEAWAARVCDDPDVEAGRQLARQWGARHGPLSVGNRLIPIYPFVTKQGSYSLENLYEADALEGMLSRADFARQIRALADERSAKFTPKNPRPRT